MTTTLWGLLLSAFVSSTVLPGGSEVLLAYLAQQQEHTTITLLAVATLGNTLGGMTTWGLGWFLAKKFSPDHISKSKHQLAIARIRRWGSPALLLSWLPIVGDPLCFAAGWLGMGWLASLLYILAGKAIRYAVILGLIDWLAT